MSSEHQTIINATQIDLLIDSNSRMERALTDLLQAQTRTEEKRAADKETQDRLWAYIERVEARCQSAEKAAGDAKSQALSNAKWINFGVAIATGIAIFIGNQIIGLIGVDKP